MKPEFWRSDDIAQLSREHRLLFIGLWSYVDDNGVGIDDYRAIAADLLAFEDDQAEARHYVREGLAMLSRALLIDRYEVDGRRYIHIRTWKKHQRVDRPNRPRHPEPPPNYTPPTSENGQPAEDFAAVSREVRETPSTGTGEQGNRGTGEEDLSSAKPPREDVDRLCDHFADLIAANTGKRPNVTKRWQDAARLLLDKDLADESDPLGVATRLADWATHDEFWRTNILSMPTFREKFHQLRLKARRQWEQTHARRTTDAKRAAVSGLVAEVFGTNGSTALRPGLRALDGGNS